MKKDLMFESTMLVHENLPKLCLKSRRTALHAIYAAYGNGCIRMSRSGLLYSQMKRNRPSHPMAALSYKSDRLALWGNILFPLIGNRF